MIKITFFDFVLIFNMPLLHLWLHHFFPSHPPSSTIPPNLPLRPSPSPPFLQSSLIISMCRQWLLILFLCLMFHNLWWPYSCCVQVVLKCFVGCLVCVCVYFVHPLNHHNSLKQFLSTCPPSIRPSLLIMVSWDFLMCVSVGRTDNQLLILI